MATFGCSDAPASQTTYSCDASERLLKAGSTSYFYNSNGNMTGRMVGKEMMAFFHDSEDWMIEAGKVINAYDVFAGCCVSSERGRYHLHLRRVAGDLLREGDWSVRLPCPFVRPGRGTVYG